MQSKMQEQFTQTKHYFALAKKDIFTPYLLGLTFLPLFLRYFLSVESFISLATLGMPRFMILCAGI